LVQLLAIRLQRELNNQNKIRSLKGSPCLWWRTLWFTVWCKLIQPFFCFPPLPEVCLLEFFESFVNWLRKRTNATQDGRSMNGKEDLKFWMEWRCKGNREQTSSEKMKNCFLKKKNSKLLKMWYKHFKHFHIMLN
jgi:hypothetical protein